MTTAAVDESLPNMCELGFPFDMTDEDDDEEDDEEDEEGDISSKT